MKSQKGVTLISLVIYVMSFLVIVSIIALISNFFFNSSKVISSQATATIEFDMLNLYLSKESKEYENWITELKDDDAAIEGIEKKIVFSNGNEYIFKKDDENEEYGKIIFSCHDKYFVLSNYIEDLKLLQLEEEGLGFPLEELKIAVKILGKEYTQNYIIER